MGRSLRPGDNRMQTRALLRSGRWKANALQEFITDIAQTDPIFSCLLKHFTGFSSGNAGW